MEISYNCKFCGKTCKNANSHRNHERLCPKNSDRVYVSHTKGKEPWNKGKSKETDDTLRVKGEKLSERYRNGEIIPSWKGKKHSEETKSKISESMKLAQSEGRAYNIGQCRWNNEHSWPEKWLIKVLNNEFDLKENKDYKTEYSFGRFSLDFAWPTNKLCIEVDGKQHQIDNAQKLRDAEKDKLLLENGWKELRIPWIECFRNPKNWIEIVREFLKGV